MGKEFLANNVYSHEDNVKLEFYEKMIKEEDHIKISYQIKDRASFYGLYNIHTKNKLNKFLIKNIKNE